MSCRNVYQEIVQYQRSRLKFCQVIGECASRAQNIPYMENEGIVELLQPLLTDPELAIRSNAVCCLSRMANHSIRVASDMIARKVPEILLRELISDRNNHMHYRRAVLQALKAMAKHTPETAAQIVECGGLSACLICLEEPDVLMKEAACCGIGSIVRQSGEMAMNAIRQGAATLLIHCLKMNELSIRQVAALALGDIVRHSAMHAKAVCECDGIASLVNLMNDIDIKLKRHSLVALGSIASHNGQMAEMIAKSDHFSTILIHLGHENVFVQRQAARLILEVSKHTLDLAQTVVNYGGIAQLVQCIIRNGHNPSKDVITPAVTALGYIAGQSPHFALAAIECKAVTTLYHALDTNALTQFQIAACVWTLGHIGQHTPEHCKHLTDENIFNKVLEIYVNHKNSEDVRLKCRTMLQSCFQCCLDVAKMEPLLYAAPPEFLECILRQLAKVLPNDPSARRIFQTVGGLKKLQDIAATANSDVLTLIKEINGCYSNEIIKYYSLGPPSLTPPKSNMPESGYGRMNQFKNPKDFFAGGSDAGMTTDCSGSISSKQSLQ